MGDELGLSTGGDVVNQSEKLVIEESAGAPPEFSSFVPEEFKEKEWAKNVPDAATFFKMIEDQRTVIAKRPADFLTKDSSPEDKAAFNKAFGVPETDEGYKFSEPQEGQEVNQEFQQGVSKLLREAGVNLDQFSVIEPGFNQLISKLVEDAGGSTEADDAKFEETAKEYFGDRTDEVMKTTKLLLEKHTHDSLKPGVNSIPDDQMLLIASAIDGIRQTYIKEGDLPAFTGSPSTGSSLEELRTRGRAIMGDPVFKNSFHPGHNKLMTEKNEIYKQIGKMLQ